MNPFERLGLPGTASPEQVTAAWRKLCMIRHPDRGGSDVEFCEIQEAYKEALALATRPPVRKVKLGFGGAFYNHSAMNQDTLDDLMRRVLAEEKAKCRTCRGHGKVVRARGFSSVVVNCPDCNGTK